MSRRSPRPPSTATTDRLTELQQKPSSELVSMRADMQIRMNVHGASIAKLRADAEAIQAILKSRQKPRFEASDHAVVRYLQKVKGVDIETIRQEIVAGATLAAAKTDVICKAKGDAVEYETDGVVYVVARLNTIVTVHLGDRTSGQSASGKNDPTDAATNHTGEGTPDPVSDLLPSNTRL